MTYEVGVALRYLATSRKRAHVALISTISIAGLAVGVAALIISLALLSGFQDRIRAQMASRTPHLVVKPAKGDRLADAELVRRALSSTPGVVSGDPVIEGRGWLTDASGRTFTPARYRNATGGAARLGGDLLPPRASRTARRPGTA